MLLGLARSRPCRDLAFAVVLCLLVLAMPWREAAAARAASMVVDFETGAILHADNADAAVYPASLTKTMTLYLLFEALRDGRVQLDTPFSVSSNAASMPPTRLGLRPGTSIAVQDALLALVTKSANDAAVVIAENLAGSESCLRRADDRQGEGARHVADHLPQCLGPARRRPAHHRARHGAPRRADDLAISRNITAGSRPGSSCSAAAPTATITGCCCATPAWTA